MASSLPIFVISVVVCLLSTYTAARQCYKCGCFIQEGEKNCSLNCTIQVLENSYCDVRRTPGELELGHGPVSVLGSLKAFHYLRATEVITYETGGTWKPAKVTQISYGCDWDLCNSPKILDIIPTSMQFAIDHKILSDTLVDSTSDSPVTCHSCTKCVTDTSNPPCPTVPCSNGTCIVDDHSIDPEFNGDCNATYVPSCESTVLDTMAKITGTLYLDDRTFQVNEVDINCRKTNCNDPMLAQKLQKNVSYVEIDSELFTRPKASAVQMGYINQPLLLCLAVFVGLLSF